jgi:pentatricopeptide repeat protein
LETLVEVHEAITRRGFQCDVFVGTALLDMYAKRGSIEKARDVFDKMPERNIVSWNAMIAGYLHNGFVDEALKLFREISQRNVVSWTAMIVGYVQNGLSLEAIEMFRQMHLAGVERDAKTFAGVLPVCATLGAMQQGMEIHGEVIRSGLESNVFVGTALVDMYAKCERIDIARNVFDKMPQRNAASWTTLIAGYAQNGHNMEALDIFRQMQQAGVEPDSKTFASVLPACANLAALQQGIEIHEEIIRSGFQCNVFLGNALLDMYAKCGSIDKASEVFNKIHVKDVVSWNSMIAGYAMHGCGNKALELFQEMQQSGMKPDRVTLVSVLSACCHAGLEDEGRKYFNSMSQYYHITPVIEHYGCMVDLLGRAGHLEEVKDLISKMPISPDATVWGSFLGACIIYNNTELGKYAAEHIFELNSKNAATYVVLSNIYAAVGRWDGTEKLRKMMKDRGIKPTAGCSWIEVNKQVHAFLAGNGLHPL